MRTPCRREQPLHYRRALRQAFGKHSLRSEPATHSGTALTPGTSAAAAQFSLRLSAFQCAWCSSIEEAGCVPRFRRRWPSVRSTGAVVPCTSLPRCCTSSTLAAHASSQEPKRPSARVRGDHPVASPCSSISGLEVRRRRPRPPHTRRACVASAAHSYERSVTMCRLSSIVFGLRTHRRCIRTSRILLCRVRNICTAVNLRTTPLPARLPLPLPTRDHYRLPLLYYARRRRGP
jgi:hypothetical protein